MAATVDKNNPPSFRDVEDFLKNLDFILPDGFMDFFKSSDGADIYTDEDFILLYKLFDMIEVNKGRDNSEYFIFGSNGSDTAYSIEKNTGFIFEMPFIGAQKEETIFLFKDFIGFKNSW
jgi:hypothetical protein